MNFGRNNVNISALKPGVYLTKFVSENNEIQTKKLIVN